MEFRKTAYRSQSLLIHQYPHDSASTSRFISRLEVQPETYVGIVPSAKTCENQSHVQVVQWDDVLVCYTTATQAFYNNISYWSRSSI